jgi:mannose-6-phosphate isomerase
LLEWDGFAVDGDKDGHLDLGYDVVLDALRLDPLSDAENAQIITRFEPNDKKSKRIFNSIADDYFRADFLAEDETPIAAGFGILLILEGSGSLAFENGENFLVEAGDAVVIAHQAGSFTLRNCKAIISRPPLA